MREHSETAWNIASKYSDVLASETRDLAAQIDAAINAERERCAQIADARAAEDHKKWQNETDWRMPYAFNRVVRASTDIAAAIRNAG